ncbi:hypothetical protein O181_024904 [Austropuccinia psidii MF-1]|uniref:Rrn7/TAF1B N-terminal cyclin domain-containing protein n=1 Tax=Austropuccinia psidii MF-1 TaxID=1389203 RepID=A0A9Q3CH18_9BASI|nr:hypothetical protein [Austropuccinia psidii MF-1]
MSLYSQSQLSELGSQSQTNNSRPTCPRCGSRRWRRDPNRGVIVCVEGHVLEGYIRESTEQTEGSVHSIRKRRLHSAHRERKEYTLKNAYRGERARWSLNLDPDLPDPSRQSSPGGVSHSEVGSELGFSSEDQYASTSCPGTPSRLSHPIASEDNVGFTPEDLKAMTDDDNSESSDDTRHETSCLDSDVPQNDLDDCNPRQVRSTTANIRVYPRMEVTVCTLYLACMQLRLPVILQDIVNMIATKQIPYLDFAQTLPQEIKEKFSASIIQNLSIEKPPPSYRHRHPSGLCYFLRQLLAILQDSTPLRVLPAMCSLNLTLLVTRFSQLLLLPTPLQALSLHLVQKLDSSWFMYTALRSNSSRSKSLQKSMLPYRISYPPEWCIMAVVFATAHYALQSHGASQDFTDPDDMLSLVKATLPEPSTWYKALITSRTSDQPQMLWEKNIVEMSGLEIDQYVKFARDFLLKDEPQTKDSPLRNRFLSSFQVEDPPERTPNDVEESCSTSKIHESLNGANIPGLLSNLLSRALTTIGAKENDFLTLVSAIDRQISKILVKTQ